MKYKNNFFEILYVIIFLLPIIPQYLTCKNYIIVITNFMLILFTLINIFIVDKKLYSLNKMVYIFSYFFFCISPIFEYNENKGYFGGNPLRESTYILTNILLITVFIIYSITYNYILKKKIYLKIEKLKNKNTIFIFSVLIFIFYIFNKDKIEFEGPIGLLFYKYIAVMPVMMFYFYWIIFNKKNKLKVFLMLLISLYIMNPLKIGRNVTAIYFLPMFIIFIQNKIFKYKNSISLILIFSFIYIFPFLDNFRKIRSGIEKSLNFKEIKWLPTKEYFLQGHLDSYQEMARVIENDIVTNGRQLLGTLLFWVPRNFWTEKPIGSGAYLASEIKLGFSNIAMNYYGEGYINFGIPGMIAFSIILGIVLGKLDKIYWGKKLYLKKNRNSFKIIYLMGIATVFFILRGDLLSSIAYTLGMIVTYKTIKKIYVIKG